LAVDAKSAKECGGAAELEVGGGGGGGEPKALNIPSSLPELFEVKEVGGGLSFKVCLCCCCRWPPKASPKENIF